MTLHTPRNWVTISEHSVADNVVLIRSHPLITQVFRPGQGWRAYPGHRRISHTWVRQARSAGITAVQLVVGGVRAEFTIEELAQP